MELLPIIYMPAVSQQLIYIQMEYLQQIFIVQMEFQQQLYTLMEYLLQLLILIMELQQIIYMQAVSQPPIYILME